MVDALMARWKPVYDFLFAVIDFFFAIALTVEALQGKTYQARCYQKGVGQFQPRFQEEGVVPGEYFFGFCNTRHILLSDGANCTVLRAVVLTQYRRDRRTDRRTDGQTDRRNCYSYSACNASIAARCKN